MTPEEKFMFDVEGYIVIKNVLTPAEVAALNARADKIFNEKKELADRRKSQVSLWGPETQALIDQPKIMPYLLELMGPKFRVDHDYCIFMTKGGRAGGLHGGESDREPDHWYKYRDGIMRNGLTVCTFFLTNANQGDGGFACVPGSHKSNFVNNLPEEVRMFKRVPHYVVQPAVEAGDALIFTEALIHGTMPWTAEHERRALLYKFSPGNSSWAPTYYNLEDYPTATAQQKRLMTPPSVGSRVNVVSA